MNAEGNAERTEEWNNPFSSRFVRPGAISFLFPSGTSAQSLVDSFHASGRRGQIVGPHGAGKSTLLATLVRTMRERGEVVALLELHDGQRRLDAHEPFARNSIVCIDGYEQLSYVSRAALAWQIRRNGCGLLITTHAPIRFPVSLPVFYEVRPRAETAVAIVAARMNELGASQSAAGIRSEEVELMFSEVRGDMRELFSRLYDLVESRRR